MHRGAAVCEGVVLALFERLFIRLAVCGGADKGHGRHHICNALAGVRRLHIAKACPVHGQLGNFKPQPVGTVPLQLAGITVADRKIQHNGVLAGLGQGIHLCAVLIKEQYGVVLIPHRSMAVAIHHMHIHLNGANIISNGTVFIQIVQFDLVLFLGYINLVEVKGARKLCSTVRGNNGVLSRRVTIVAGLIHGGVLPTKHIARNQQREFAFLAHIIQPGAVRQRGHLGLPVLVRQHRTVAVRLRLKIGTAAVRRPLNQNRIPYLTFGTATHQHHIALSVIIGQILAGRGKAVIRRRQ